MSQLFRVQRLARSVSRSQTACIGLQFQLGFGETGTTTFKILHVQTKRVPWQLSMHVRVPWGAAALMHLPPWVCFSG